MCKSLLQNYHWYKIQCINFIKKLSFGDLITLKENLKNNFLIITNYHWYEIKSIEHLKRTELGDLIMLKENLSSNCFLLDGLWFTHIS